MNRSLSISLAESGQICMWWRKIIEREIFPNRTVKSSKVSQLEDFLEQYGCEYIWINGPYLIFNTEEDKVFFELRWVF